MSKRKPPTLLVILDGYGLAPPSKYNAITLSKRPTLDRLFELYPHTELGAAGKDVGLEDDKTSGSEAGHMNIGAGRIVQQDSYFITESIENGSFFTNPVLIGAVHHARDCGSVFHIMGLMGDYDSPHSDPNHFRAILKLAKKNGAREVFCHLFTDGRDSYPRSAKIHLKHFQSIMQEEGIGRIASLSGRFYAMDRSKNWDRLIGAYEAIAFSKGEKASSPEEAIEKAYASGLTDEYLLPTVIYANDVPVAKLGDNDSVVFFNLRSDRARQFTKLFVPCSKNCLINDDMPEIKRVENLYFAALTNFGPDLDVHTAWQGHTLAGTLPMANGKLSQFYIAETEKFAHITYFLNGGYADPVNDENRVMIPSPKVNSYARIPQMAAAKITQNILGNLQKELYDFYAVNFANADMVGHTGELAATVKACNVLDEQINILAKEVLRRKGNLIITADHGNAELMFDATSDQPNTFHTKNPVPFLLAGEKFRKRKLESGGVLGNIAPTILEILEVEKPQVMKKNSLLK